MEEGKGIDHLSKVDLMTAFAGAIGRLLPMLGEFLQQEHNLRTSTPMKKHLLKSLEIHLRRMEDALLVVRMMPRAQQDHQVVVEPQEDKHYPSYELIRGLEHDTEDIVYSLMIHIDVGKQSTREAPPPVFLRKNESEEMTWRIKTLDNIKVRVKNLAAWRELIFVPTTTRTVKPYFEDGFKQVRQIVGIQKLKAELMSTISSSSQQLKIVSIWGAEGMGKTTLAKAVYENIKSTFPYTAFVSLGPQPDMKKASRDILIHLDEQKYSDLDTAKLEFSQLIEELRDFLGNKRYLIVIDDISDVPSLDITKFASVNNDCGGRIIITSRVLGVAESSGEVLKLMPLSIDCSKELFYATLCGHKGSVDFDQLDEHTIEYILQKCGCVPLAIIMIASLLSGKPQEEWAEVYNSIGFGQEDNIGAENNIRKILQFSYYDLPSHLKTCLLYLSIFPDDYVIEKDTLVWRWVAEGFVNDAEQEESLFKIGERYFYELVSRSMIQVIENGGTNIRAWRVEGMVLEWIRFVAQEQDYVNIIASWNHGQHLFIDQSNNAPIMVVHKGTLYSRNHVQNSAGTWKQKVRSFNVIGSRIESRMLTPIFRGLRVLSLEDCELRDSGLEDLVGRLLHLRYLVVRGTRFYSLVIEIGGLRYLQTLELTRTKPYVIRELTRSVTGLRELKCLRVDRLSLPEGIVGKLTSLEELRLEELRLYQPSTVSKSPNLAEELSKLTELRVLHISFCGHISIMGLDDEWYMEALVKSLSKLQKIEELELFCVMTCRHVIAPGGFPRLRHFRTNIWLMYQPGAMPCIKTVELEVNVRGFNDASFDLHKLSYLRLLEEVSIAIVCREAKMEEAEEAEIALRRALESHPNHPKLFLRRIGQCVGDEQEQCQDYKQIRFLDGLHGSGAGPQVMPLELLREITNNFSEKQRLGSGTFGTVYKGVLEGKELAVKRLHSMSQRLDYEEDFKKEFENLSRLDHPNIVRLLGYCYEIKRVCVKYEENYVLADDTYRALCFDYMRNGSLQQHLHDESGGLDWQTRYKIIKGTCEGLKYLHKGLENPMFHLDLKPGNILLDENMAPKLADFGLSKLVCDNQTQATSNFLGTIRYCPPEHIEGHIFSNKFDIFSLGVVMIEIIAGPQGYNMTSEMPSEAFVDHVQEKWIKRLHQATTDCTSPKCECLQVKRCVEIALECVHRERMQRPDIEDITSMLNETENKSA